MAPRRFEELAVGDEARLQVTITAADIDRFADLSGDVNPLHLDPAFAKLFGFRDRVAHGMLIAAHLSRILGTELPGPGCLWLSQEMRFRQAAYEGDTLEILVRVVHRSEELRLLVLATTIDNQRGETVLTGEAKVTVLQQGTPIPWEDTVAVVTGSSRGIGAAVAEALGERGASVVVNYLERADAADEVVRKIENAGGKSVAVQADVGTEDGARALAAAATHAFGRVDVLVCNATPTIERKPFLETSWAEAEQAWRTYVGSAWTLAREVVEPMKRRGHGRIISILTSAVFGAPPSGTSAYVAAKSALWGLTRSLAVELAPFGITANAVSPSAVTTEQWDDATDARRRSIAMHVPAQRLASPQEVAAAVVFLAGNDGAYVTGANLPVAGGEVM